MFIENRKLSAVSATLAVIGLVSATSILRAYPVRATMQGDATPSSSAPGNSQRASERSPNGPETKSAQAADGQVKDVEKGLIRLAELQADAELLEITLDGQRAGIQHSIQFLRGRVSRYAVQDRDGGKDWQQSLQKANEQLNVDTESYRKNKIKLALLRYQIVRESKALGVSLDASAPLAEINRRLDRLEEKIDRLAGTLSGKTVP